MGGHKLGIPNVTGSLASSQSYLDWRTLNEIIGKITDKYAVIKKWSPNTRIKLQRLIDEGKMEYGIVSRDIKIKPSTIIKRFK